MTETEGPSLNSFTAGDHHVVELTGGTIGIVRDATDVVGNASFMGAEYVILEVDRVNPEFFDLSSGFAGEVLQKFANYRVGVVIFGDPESVAGKVSESLRALIRESNRGGQVWFAKDREEAIARIVRA